MPKRMNAQFRPLPLFGAEVTGWDFDYLPDAESINLLRLGLLKFKMLLFRGRVLSPEELLAFTRLFGVELFRGDRKYWLSQEHPDVFRISNQPQEGTSHVAEEWHSDGHYLPEPCGITAHHMVQSVPEDGHLLVSDLAAAYRRLPPKQRQKLSMLLSVNEGSNVIQSLVKKHPVTGVYGLYLNLLAKTVDASGRRYSEVDRLLREVLDTPGTYYEHACLPGDTILVDNFAVCHRMAPSCASNPQIMHRAQTTGRGVWWRWTDRDASDIVAQMEQLNFDPSKQLHTILQRAEIAHCSPETVSH